METLKNYKIFVKKFVFILLMALVSYITFGAEKSFALTAEYKCTSKCSMCINYPKKTVCSNSYSEDGDEFMKAKKLAKMVNDGLINPDDKLKPGFTLESFGKKYFDCDIMVKKAEQIKEATQNMCNGKIAKGGGKKSNMMPRMPASKPKKATKIEEELEE